MLKKLSISNIVLIDRLDIEFGRGLNALTGETGAGKSILLDALSLGLGARADIGLIRHGTESAQVIAEFENTGDKLNEILSENEIESDDTLILRRTLSVDGKSRAWINGIPVSVKTLKMAGDLLVEIHGQFENHSLLDQTTHQKTLDDFAIKYIDGFSELLSLVKSSYSELHSAEKRLDELKKLIEKSANEREFLEYNVSELSALNPETGEEEDLNNRRNAIINSEKNTAILSDAIEIINQKGNSLDNCVYNVARTLEKIKTDPNPYAGQIEKLYEIAENISDVSSKLRPHSETDENVDDIEERLFALRAAARKHRIPADELPDLLLKMQNQLNMIDNSDAELKKLEISVKEKQGEFNKLASNLTIARKSASEILRKQILTELPDLKLGQADFIVDFSDKNPTARGADEITFMIKTNPGNPFSPLHKTASGGELARLMLALRVVFINPDDFAFTFIFDEVDTGISGATAQAVGNRLSRLSAASQALVITHSAQVAGYADKHFKIEKFVENDITTTSVREISDDEKINEIARIISGAEITPESIATAKTLIKSF